MNKNKVSFIGIGFQRCGSTWIHRILDEHPEISKHTKGLHYFNINYEKGENWYIEQFNTLDQSKILGEFSTTYSYPEYYKKTMKRMYEFNKNLKIILTIRHPTERYISDYRRSVKRSEIDNVNIIDSLERYPELFSRGLYTKVIEELEKYFPLSQVLIINYSDIKINPSQVVHRIYTFLNVNNEFIPSTLNKKQGATYNMKYIFIEKIIIKLQKYIGHMLDSLRLNKLKKNIKQTGIIDIIRNFNKKKEGDDNETKSMKEILDEKYANEIKLLNNKYNIKF